MEFDIEIFEYAMKKEHENNLFEMWKIQYFNRMQLDKYIDFEEYKKECTKDKEINNHTKISYEQVEIEMEQVEAAFKRKEDAQNGII